MKSSVLREIKRGREDKKANLELYRGRQTDTIFGRSEGKIRRFFS